MNAARFASRAAAGILLGERLAHMSIADPLVLALPRGGVPVAVAVARVLDAPLDLLMVRKIGVPWHPELAAAAVVDGERPDVVLNRSVMDAVGLHGPDIQDLLPAHLREIERRRRAYLGTRTPLVAAGKSVIVVDDGVATGTSIRAALAAVRRRDPARLVLAVPVAPADTVLDLTPLVDDLVCLRQPRRFTAVGAYFDDFHQLDDQEVVELMAAVPAS